MKRLLVLTVAALLLGPLISGEAQARFGGGGGGFRGGGGFAGGGFAGGGFRGAGFAGGGFRGAAIGGVGGARWAGAAIGRPGWGVGRPGWVVGRPGWGAGRPGWGVAGGWARPGWGWNRWHRWPLWGAAAGLGIAAAGFYGGFPYDDGFSGYDCPTVQQRVWDGWGWRIVWANSCDSY
ncbi:MAG: hypothetical protein WDO17_03660 [Alphaproteobacteria bacterium]